MKQTRKVKAMQADKGQFDEVLRRMLKKNPQKTSEIKNPRKRRNPETDPRYLPVIDFSKPPMLLTPEQEDQIKEAQRIDREYRATHEQKKKR